MGGPDHNTVSAPLAVPPTAITSSSTPIAPWSAAIRTHSTATFRPTATILRSASAMASVREPPPIRGEREIALSSPESAWVPVMIVTPCFRRAAAVSLENSHSPGFVNPITCVTTTSLMPDPLSTSEKTCAVFPEELATTTVFTPSSSALSREKRAASAVFSAPGVSQNSSIFVQQMS